MGPASPSLCRSRSSGWGWCWGGSWVRTCCWILAQRGAGGDGQTDGWLAGGGWGAADTIALVSVTRLLNA